MVFRLKPQQNQQRIHSHRMVSDYHLHSQFSPDAHSSIDRLCRKALELGLQSIAVTDHIEWRQRGSGNQQPEVYFEHLYEAREKYKPMGLMVMSGVEVGNPHEYPRKFNALLSLYPFEVVIASLHWLGDDNIHDTGVFDGRDPQQVYHRYFREMHALVQLADFDILAHLDRIFWTGMQLGAPPDLKRLEPVIRSVAAALVERGQILELNTKYLHQLPRWNESTRLLFRWFREEGGTRVVVNSDAHTPGELARHFEAAREILVGAGLEEVVDLTPAAQGAVLP